MLFPSFFVEYFPNYTEAIWADDTFCAVAAFCIYAIFVVDTFLRFLDFHACYAVSC